jgi:putative hydrolase
MNIKIDTHVHTMASGHAYSVLSDYVRTAVEKGIEMFALTDHGPEMPGGPHLYHLANQLIIPKVMDGIEILKGVEANIIDYNGEIDIPNYILKRLDIVLASLHPPCLEAGSIEKNTAAITNAIKSGKVDIIGHPGNPAFQIDIYEVVRCAKEYNVALEINSGSFRSSRITSWDNCVKIARACKEVGTFVTTGSDSHIHCHLGEFGKIYKIFDEVDFPIELVITESKDKLKEFLSKRR